ncbi:MAG: putative phage abortive infection protein, partial [Ramlibacter sp.]
MELTLRVVEQMEGPSRKGKILVKAPGGKDVHAELPRRTRFSGLDSHARKIFDTVPASAYQGTTEQLLEHLMKSFFKTTGVRPSMFGRYFRVLRELFSHIASSSVPSALQERYANIARSQISDGAVLLVAAYGLTPEGHSFAPLIERFGLLQHMHRRYRELLGPAIALAYRPTAFEGGGTFDSPKLADER